jgi:peptidoglycan/xylan/chitin deacetylase (PgdA/CDA1 family)
MKPIRSLFLMAVFCLQIQTLPAQPVIRINQLGYTPGSIKVAVLGGATQVPINRFVLCDALTGRVVFTSDKVNTFGQWGPFSTSLRLDFSGFTRSGAFFIEAGGIQSPVFRVGIDVYDGSADYLLNYMRQQRCGYNPFLHDSCHTRDGYVIYRQGYDSVHIDVTGGWHDATDYLQYTATSANAVMQMLLAWHLYPEVFGDRYLENGEPGPNGVPDILDEAMWGMDWLMKMNPDSGEMYNQIADDRDHQGFRLPNNDIVSYGKGLERPVYFCTGLPQGLFSYQNRATGIASTAGKFASAFAMGAMVLTDSKPGLKETLTRKAIAAYAFGTANPGNCQTAPCTAPYFYEEDNWTDDMELAGSLLYSLTGERPYLDSAAGWGRIEKITPWMGADTARHYQWYPFLNMGHWGMTLAGQPQLTAEYMSYWKQGLEAVFQQGKDNPFLNGIPFIWCSNNLTVALITQCHLYARITGDHRYDEMEASLRDWLFGCNPWGSSMVVGLPAYGDHPADPHSSLAVLHQYRLDGALVDGPVYNSIFKNLKGLYLNQPDEYQAYQSSVTVYHDDYADYSTNEPTMDGTADFTCYLSAMQAEAHDGKMPPVPEYDHGAIVRGTGKKICLVFTGHEFADGYRVIRKVLQKHRIQGSFFLTGDFYRNPRLRHVVAGLKKDNHYLGGHSDRHLLYCDWSDRDSLLVSKTEFIRDLKENYAAMEKAGISADKAPFFLPPYEWYNDSIAAWCTQYGLHLVNFTPGTGSNQDWTWPAGDSRYIDSETIYRQILAFEEDQPKGLDGFILLTHLGTDPRRKDKFYNRLDSLLTELERRGYTMVSLGEITGNPIPVNH